MHFDTLSRNGTRAIETAVQAAETGL